MNIKIEYEGGAGEHHRKFTIEVDLGNGHSMWASDVVKEAIEVLTMHDPATWKVTPSLPALQRLSGNGAAVH